MVKRMLLVLVIAGFACTALYQLCPAAEILPGPGYLDMHVHAAGAGGSGCFLSERMRHGYKFKFYLWAFGVSSEEMERRRRVIKEPSLAFVRGSAVPR